MKNHLRVVRDGRGIRFHLHQCTDDELMTIAQNAQAQIESTQRFLFAVATELRIREGMNLRGPVGA